MSNDEMTAVLLHALETIGRAAYAGAVSDSLPPAARDAFAAIETVATVARFETVYHLGEHTK